MRDRFTGTLLGLLAAGYAAFWAIDCGGSEALYPAGLWIKQGCICLCLLLAVARLGGRPSRRGAYLAGALFFTALADTQLLFGGPPVWGMALFQLAQGLHLMYVRPRAAQALIPAHLAGLAAGVAAGLDPFALAAGFYAAGLLENLLCSFLSWRAERSPARWRTAWGFVLFALCDVNVALFNLPGVLPSMPGWYTQGVYEAASALMWFWYLPGQALLALGGREGIFARGRTTAAIRRIE